MRVFLTGATGFIGSQIVPQLITAGHQVLGLTRSDSGAEALTKAGAEPHRGDIEDLDSIRSGASKADGVIHCAFDHDFTNFAANCEKDRRVIEALGDVIAGSNRPLVITSGVGLGSRVPDQPATEDYFNATYHNPRIASEEAGQFVAKRGVNVSVVRLPQVHDTQKQGLITPYIEVIRHKGTVAYIGEGRNRWSAAHVSDVAHLYRLALERAEPGSVYNAVAEEGISAREIAEVIGRGMKLPVISISQAQAPEYLSWMAMFIALDLPATSTITQQKLNWHPTGPGLLEDLGNMKF